MSDPTGRLFVRDFEAVAVPGVLRLVRVHGSHWFDDGLECAPSGDVPIRGTGGAENRAGFPKQPI